MCWKEHLSSPAEEGVTVESVFHHIHSWEAQGTFIPYVWFLAALGGQPGREYIWLILRGKGRKGECPKSHSSDVTGTWGGM